ncbi:PQ loop repeat protein [Talaromyces proteolyticus]|uniref:PQ loop repeat protein n=1 Tax=Talaromyces proteolyticus TaxID=1131652 RepID=A0AAD4L1R6_9EURO|nr:PQ loop repeat protein [Talaromyces proteolyticus]KAH8702270.1 PQ loop repeat protein [Talaromyces proteolyticus]
MFPPQSGNLDIDALSGILGSISIACWVVVFSPQIIENFRRGSADGLSLLFVVVWLAGDVFNILGSVLQGVLPTMIILAVYYTLADIVLLGQCFYYRGFTLSDEPAKQIKPNGQDAESQEPTERTTLLENGSGNGNGHPTEDYQTTADHRHAHSQWIHVDGTHLSPATPFIDATEINTSVQPSRPPSNLQAAFFNIFAIVLVCAAGILGWYVSSHLTKRSKSEQDLPTPGAALTLDFWGQVFGYLCAVLYLGSRIPQLLLNYRRKSTEGVSLLFFLFACIGNLTYVLSIFAYEPVCRSDVCGPGEAAAVYGRYILVNLSWLVGSLGTLLLDMAIFVQFFLYRKDDDWDEGEGDEEES